MAAEIEDNTQRLFENALDNYEKARRLILLAGAEIVAQELKKNTPVYPDNRVNAKDEVGISNMRTDKNTREKYLAVGYSRKVSHRIHVTEFGSMYQRPQAFMTRTNKQSSSRVLNAMQSKARSYL